MKTTLEILREARELISVPERWTMGYYARNADGDDADSCSPAAVCWCAIGAINKSAGVDDDVEPDDTIAATYVEVERDAGVRDLARWNDAEETSHADVLRVFDETIARLEKAP